MAHVPYPFDYEESPTGFPSLLRRVWLRLYPQGEDPMFQVYCEKLADFVHEYRAEVFLFTSSAVGNLSRSVMSTHASILADYVGPPSAEVCQTEAISLKWMT